MLCSAVASSAGACGSSCSASMASSRRRKPPRLDLRVDQGRLRMQFDARDHERIAADVIAAR